MVNCKQYDTREDGCYKCGRRTDYCIYVVCFFFCREDLAQIALYNMTVDHNTKYYDFYDELMPWINTNWDLISPGKVCTVEPTLGLKL